MLPILRVFASRRMTKLRSRVRDPEQVDSSTRTRKRSRTSLASSLAPNSIITSASSSSADIGFMSQSLPDVDLRQSGDDDNNEQGDVGGDMCDQHDLPTLPLNEHSILPADTSHFDEDEHEIGDVSTVSFQPLPPLVRSTRDEYVSLLEDSRDVNDRRRFWYCGDGYFFFPDHEFDRNGVIRLSQTRYSYGVWLSSGDRGVGQYECHCKIIPVPGPLCPHHDLILKHKASLEIEWIEAVARRTDEYNAASKATHVFVLDSPTTGYASRVFAIIEPETLPAIALLRKESLSVSCGCRHPCLHVDKVIKWMQIAIPLDDASVKGYFERSRRHRLHSQKYNDAIDDRLPLSCQPIAVPVLWGGTGSKSPRNNINATAWLPEDAPARLLAASHCGKCARTFDESDLLVGNGAQGSLFLSRRKENVSVHARTCSACQHVTSFDGNECGILYWTVKLLFAHDVLNDFTRFMTVDGLSFDSWREVLLQIYRETQPDVVMFSLDVFIEAWFGFVGLQQWNYALSCSMCGLKPKKVIVDGITLHSSEHVVTNLQPPTIPNTLPKVPLIDISATPKFFLNKPQRTGLKKAIVLLAAARKACVEANMTKWMVDNQSLQQCEPSLVAFITVVAQWQCSDLASLVGEVFFTSVAALLKSLSSQELVIQLVCYEASKLMAVHCTTLATLINFVVHDSSFVHFHSICPIFGALLKALRPLIAAPHSSRSERGDDETIALGLMSCHQLLKRVAQRALAYSKNTCAQRPTTAAPLFEGPELPCEMTGSCHGRRIRSRPDYAQDRTLDPAGCTKSFTKTAKRSGGAMVAWCAHGLCLGFHMMPKAEGRNDVFSLLLCHFEEAPDLLVYDFACALKAYCDAREPGFFQKCLMSIDRFHEVNHTGCSAASALSCYADAHNADCVEFKSTAAEVGNSRLRLIAQMVKYMGASRFVRLVRLFLHIHNIMKMAEMAKRTM